MALTTPKDIDGNPNPYFDDVTNDDVPDGRVEIREGYIQEAYQEADNTLALGRQLMGGGDITTMVGSDHGFASQWLAVNVSKVLVDLGLQGRTERELPQGRERPRHHQPGRHARQGMPRRRHIADLSQCRRPRPSRRQHAADPGGRLRDRAQPDRRGVPSSTT